LEPSSAACSVSSGLPLFSGSPQTACPMACAQPPAAGCAAAQTTSAWWSAPARRPPQPRGARRPFPRTAGKRNIKVIDTAPSSIGASPHLRDRLLEGPRRSRNSSARTADGCRLLRLSKPARPPRPDSPAYARQRAIGVQITEEDFPTERSRSQADRLANTSSKCTVST